MFSSEYKSTCNSRLRLRTLLILAITFTSCGITWAQEPKDAAAAPEAKKQYKVLPVDESFKKSYITINPILMSGRFSPEQQPAFDDFYQKYFLPRWTVPEDLAKLPSYRKELRNSHFGKKSGATEVHDHLNTLVLNFMKDLVSGPYHPAVQINAMLMIGELNSIESSAEHPATPLPEALPLMIAAVGSSNLSDAVRAAALVGIQRHAVAGVADPDVRQTLITTLLKIADGDIPAGTAMAGRQWILGQAIETLATLGALGDGNAVFKATLQTVGNSKLSLSTRAIAAASLGRFNYAGANGINPAEAASVLGQFIVDLCTEELSKSKAKKTGEPISRQRMQQCLVAVRTALDGDGEANHKGIASLVKAQDQKTAIDKLRKYIESMSEQIDKWREGDDLTDSVDKLQSDLEAWLKKGK
jgi:hypothetical protein